MAPSSESARLVTIPFSHFCEKARWALDRARIEYREEAHAPLLSWPFAIAAGRGRTVPQLLAEGRKIGDSTDILRYCDARGRGAALFPEGDPEVARLEEDLDRRFGPATRRLAYFHLLADRALTRRTLTARLPRWEAGVAGAVAPAIVLGIRRGLRIDAAGAERSREAIERTFDQLDALLRDGRPYLGGDRFSAADLTLASLATPLIWPAEYARFAFPEDDLPPSYRTIVERYRARPTGRHVVRMYATERCPHRDGHLR